MKVFTLGMAGFTLATTSVAIAQSVGPVPRVTEIEWPDAPPTGTSAGDKRLSALGTVRLPVMLPEQFLEFTSLKLVGEALQYQASVLANWGSMQIFGTRVALDVAEVDGAPAPGSGDVSFDDQSAELAFNRYGAAYVVRVECLAIADRRCTDAAFVTRLAGTAMQVGGLQDGSEKPLAPPPMTSGGPMATSGTAGTFTWLAPGLLKGSNRQGNLSKFVYAPGIRFPVEGAPAYLGSMVYGYGGNLGAHPNVSWKDARNYAYPWQDNFCEPRQWRTPLCPGGSGHQGVDIRPMDARKAVHWAVAAEDGVIGGARGWSVQLLGKSGTRYDYLHLQMNRLAVGVGTRVRAGDRIGLISDKYSVPTPVHLHFEMRQNLSGKGVTPVPPYMSLVRAYEAM